MEVILEISSLQIYVYIHYTYICSSGFGQCGTAGYSIVTEVDKLYGVLYFLNTCFTLVVVERLDALVLFIEDDARLKVAHVRWEGVNLAGHDGH